MASSLFSWGMPPRHPAVLTSGEEPSGQDDLTVQDVTEETDRRQLTTEEAVEEMAVPTRLDVSSLCGVSENWSLSF